MTKHSKRWRNWQRASRRRKRRFTLGLAAFIYELFIHNDY